MKVQKAIVQYKDRDDIICMYGIIDDGTKEGKNLYFLGDDETKKFSNGNRVVTESLTEAVDPMIEPKHIGLIDKKGNVIIPFDNRAIKPINDKTILVEKAVPVSQSVIDAVESKKDSVAASKLVSTSAAIKDAMNLKMGPEGRFLFNDQFSEATLCDIDGKNLVNDQYYSYISLSNDVIYLSTNVADSPISEFSLSKGEFIQEDKSNEVIDVGEVNVDPQVVDNAMANAVVPVADNAVQEVSVENKNEEMLDMPDVGAVVQPAANEEVKPPLGFDDFFMSEGSTLPPDSIEVTSELQKTLDLEKNAAEVSNDLPPENKEEFVPDIPNASENTNEEVVGDNSLPAPPASENVEEQVLDDTQATPPLVDVSEELKNIEVKLEEGNHNEVPVPDMNEVVANNAPLIPTLQELEGVAPVAAEEEKATEEVSLEAAPVEEVPVEEATEEEKSAENSVIPELVQSENKEETEEKTEEVKNENSVIPELVQPVNKEAEEVVETVAEIPELPKEEVVEEKQEVVEEATPIEEAPVEETTEEVQAEVPVEETATEEQVPVEEVKEEIDDTNVINPTDVALTVDKDSNGILDSDEFVVGRGLNDRIATDIDLDLDLDLDTTTSYSTSRDGNSFMDDVAKSMAKLVKQNKEQKATISNLQDKLNSVDAQRRNVVEKYKDLSRKLEIVTNKLKSLDAVTARMDTKIKEKDKTIANLQSRVRTLNEQINGKQDLVNILRDAEQLLDNDYYDDNSYIGKIA